MADGPGQAGGSDQSAPLFVVSARTISGIFTVLWRLGVVAMFVIGVTELRAARREVREETTGISITLAQALTVLRDRLPRTPFNTDSTHFEYPQ